MGEVRPEIFEVQQSAFSYQQSATEKSFFGKMSGKLFSSNRKNNLRVHKGVRTPSGQPPDKPRTAGMESGQWKMENILKTQKQAVVIPCMGQLERWDDQ